MERNRKIANNMLEFLIDPTKFPPEKRLYFRPEEILDNRTFDAAKADAKEAYRDQKYNSDFYPLRNRTNREATVDRKTIIASMDILSQNFKEGDPITENLKAMATTLAKMSEEELEERLAASVEAKAETIKCPKCGTKVLKQTGYCLKCRKKIRGEKKADEEEILDMWTKEASDAVKNTLLAEIGVTKKAKEDKKEPEPKKEVEDKKEPDKIPEEPKKEVEAKKEPEKKVEDKKIPEKEVEAQEPEKVVVDTSVLSFVDGIEIEAGMVSAEDIGDLTAEEKSCLDQLFK